MSLRHVLSLLSRTFLILAFASTTYLYLYPFWFGCAFPSVKGSSQHGFYNTVAQHFGGGGDDARLAPFRLLVLADPQLEGDSSLPDPEDALSAKIQSHYLRLKETSVSSLSHDIAQIVKELIAENVPQALQGFRKVLDLFGNDYYLAHIYRTLHWWSNPTHVTVLGDLIGSQWTTDDEFEWRGWRYWNRVFAGTSMVDETVMSMHERDTEEQESIPLASEDQHWERKIINIPGNHDIGYAGDISPSRIARFERKFGKANWDVQFTYPPDALPDGFESRTRESPSIQLIVLNSMLLDGPALSSDLQDDQYSYINSLISTRLSPVHRRNDTFTLLLTHVPLHKPEGTCVDGPFFDYWDFQDADGKFNNGGLREQNHLSEHTSQQGVLGSIFGMTGDQGATEDGIGRKGLVLTGHDHEGCDVVHYIVKRDSSSAEPPPEQTDEESSSWSWHVNRTSDFYASRSDLTRQVHTSLREVTLRSMMGSYGGNAGLLSLWYDFDAHGGTGEWQYEIQMCALGVQHVWWAVHVVDLIAVVLVLAQMFFWYRHRRSLSRSSLVKITKTE